LSEVLTETNFARMLALAERLAVEARKAVKLHGLTWCIAQSGARVETMWSPEPPVNATQVAHVRNGTLESLLHVYFLNRGIIITPFHCMLLMCPATSEADVSRYVAAFTEFCKEIALLQAGSR
jgi:glutamate-1-semialdehyde 2,1-aminomutase